MAMATYTLAGRFRSLMRRLHRHVLKMQRPALSTLSAPVYDSRNWSKTYMDSITPRR